MHPAIKEHLGYLSDGQRTLKFRQALARAVRPGDLVADLGCGFGVLGMICLQEGAARVWGIDSTDAIDIARESMARAGLADRYTCLRERSFNVTLPELVDIAICDHVGYFGFDYGIVEMAADARRRMLKPGGRIIPGRIILHLAGAGSADCRALADAWEAESMPAEFGWLREYAVNAKHRRMFEPEEICTDVAELGTIDLNADNPDSLSFKVALRASHDTMIDGLAGWFNCEIADDIWMTNSPLAADKIERYQIFLPFETPIEVLAGEEIAVTLSIRHEGELLAWSARAPRSGSRQKHTNWHNRFLTRAEHDTASPQVRQLNQHGALRKQIYELIDGKRTGLEIEQTILRDHSALLPNEAELRRLIRHELARGTD